jgi:hypothetical protein
MKKKHLKTAVCAALIGSMLLASGCGDTKAVEASEFKASMKKLGLEINDQSAEYKDQGADAVIVGYVKDEYQMELYHFKEKEQADQTYTKLTDQLIEGYEGTDGYSIEKKQANNKSTAVVTGDGNYFEAVLIDTTLVYGVTSNGSEHKDEIKKAFDEIGY